MGEIGVYYKVVKTGGVRMLMLLLTLIAII